MASAGRYFDGRAARPQDVTVTAGGATLIITDDRGRHVAGWPLNELRALPGRADDGLFVLAPRDGAARLECADPVLRQTLQRQVGRLTRGPSRRRGIGKVALWAGAAVAALGVTILVIVPRLAETFVPLIEPEIEVAMGDQVRLRLADISPLLMDERAQACVDPAGLAAMDAMVARLSKGLKLPYPLRVEVWNADVVNAITLPGGRIIFFKGLLDEAQSAEEVAGVLAHEIGHAAHQDGLRLSMRAAGSAGLLGLMVGDASGGLAATVAAEQLLNASYTREAELAADAFALDMMARTGVDPEGFAEFFERMGAEAGETPAMLDHFATHPDLASRAARARAHEGAARLRPVLGAEEWDALRAICTQVAPI